MRKKTIISWSFILIGLILLSIPLVYEWQKEKEKQAVEEALRLINRADGDKVDLSKIDNLSIPENQLKNVLELEIPTLDLKEKVLPTATQENLSVALAQIKTNQTPGKGNFTIAGHRGYRGGRHFSELPKLTPGKKVLLHYKHYTYEYKITKSSVIDPSDVYILNDKKGENQITLVTCTLDGKKRFILKGSLVKIFSS